ncbi:MAG: hypothetical protein LUD00_12400 [Prevotellaceae bacterium]|nr:hypothetical protein [Prevotellaceae bacterium]
MNGTDKGWAHTYVKGVTDALVLTVQEFSQNSFSLSKTKQQGCHVGVLYTADNGFATLLEWQNSKSTYINTSAWGFCVARFDKLGNARSL